MKRFNVADSIPPALLSLQRNEHMLADITVE
jgi:hypothetical protein